MSFRNSSSKQTIKHSLNKNTHFSTIHVLLLFFILIISNEISSSEVTSTSPSVLQAENETTITNTNTPSTVPATTLTDEEEVEEPYYPPWSGCIDPKTKNPDEKIKKGDKTTVCIVISSDNWTKKGMVYSRVTFRPTADEYSSISLQDSFHDLVIAKEVKGNRYKPYVSVHVESQQSLSYIRRYHNLEEHKVYPYLTTIIDVEQGKVKGILWDESCLFCNSTRCEENTFDFQGNQETSISNTKGCFIPVPDCAGTVEEEITLGTKLKTAECNLKIYVVWTGTDVDGKPLQSYESRFGAFPPNVIPKFSIPSISSTVMKKFSDLKDRLNIKNQTKRL